MSSKQFTDAPITTWESDGECPCECGLAPEQCAPNPCLRKKIHLAGLTPGSKWPEGAPCIPQVTLQREGDHG